MEQTTIMAEGVRLVTAEELERFPEDDWRYEPVEGRLVRMSPVGLPHGEIAARIVALLYAYVQPRQLGLLVTEVGFKLASNPDTVRAPAVAFVRRDRLAAGSRRGFWHGPPDLAVEVLSPHDRPSEVQAKIEEYLSCGTILVLVVDPDAATVTLHRRLSAPVTLTGPDAPLDMSRWNLSDSVGRTARVGRLRYGTIPRADAQR
jgi:Uma2 family endonuclease